MEADATFSVVGNEGQKKTVLLFVHNDMEIEGTTVQVVNIKKAVGLTHINLSAYILVGMTQ